MKFQDLNIPVPAEKRDLYNSKILSLIQSGELHGFTQEQIFSLYTGIGGLHGLNRDDFANYHEFSEAKKEFENGQFWTPDAITKEVISRLGISGNDLVCDLTCGKGSFFNHLPNEKNVYGCELDTKAFKVSQFLFPEANIQNKDIRQYNPDVKFDFILGNPPFNLSWDFEGETFNSQIYYCLKAAKYLKPGALMAIVVPRSFLADEFFSKTAIERVFEGLNFIVQYELPKDAFRSLGVASFETKVVYLQRKSSNIEERPYDASLLLPYNDSRINDYLAPVVEQRKNMRASFILELTKNSQEDKEFGYKLKKYLYEIKQHPSINKYYAKALAYLEKYRTQEKPKDMEQKEWDKTKITEAKVLSYLKRTIKKQEKKPVRDEIRLVKAKNSLKLKAYSPKMKKALQKLENTEFSLIDLVRNGQTEIKEAKVLGISNPYTKLIAKKHRLFIQENASILEQEVSPEVQKYVDGFRFQGKNGIAKFTDLQKSDLSRFISRRFSAINWSMGGGKTACTYAWAKFQIENKIVRNAVILAPSVAINLTWKVFLEKHKENFIKIEKRSDFEKIQPGQFMLISVKMLTKLQREMKRFVKHQNQKVALVFDESDEITNPGSKAAKAALNCFRRLNRKVIGTGTLTRNNINELYTQLELLFNNSVNLLSENFYVYKEKKDSGTGEKYLSEELNEYYNRPFPAYSGSLHFKRSFSPTNTTVFGIQQENQNIYNQEELKALIDKTVITRSFKEIAGDDKYEIKNIQILQDIYEKEVYRTIMEELYELIPQHFNPSDSSKKDAMLRIIRQLNLLIKATSIPQTFSTYKGSSVTTKMGKIAEMVKGMKGQVAIGCLTLNAVDIYEAFMKKMFPERPVYIIKGEISFKKRQAIIAEFSQTKNGILICTQQSLKSSVNIPSCSDCIIESLPWNLSKCSQFYFRFIRFDSKKKANVYLVTYADSIESNLLALLMAKERLNDFIKTREYKERSEVFTDFNIDLDILNNVLQKVKEEHGYSLSWGSQKVA